MANLPCKICGKGVVAKGLCPTHYSKERRASLRLLSTPAVRQYVNLGKFCDVCSQPAHSRGMCYLHYRRFHEGRPLELGRMKNAGLSCVKCKDPAYCRGLCLKHYNKSRRNL